MSLFGGAPSQARSRNLVEFKAGKMNLRGNMVYPDKRKGLVYLYRGHDLLMHLCWKERTSNTPEVDLVIFPDEIEFKRVTQNTTGRVYILKWKSNARKLFFWMQEPKEDKDEEYCKKINDFINHPPAPGSGGDDAHPLQPFMERMAGSGAGGIDPNDLSNVLRTMNPNDFASLLSSFGGSGGATGLMQGLQRRERATGTSTQQGTLSSLLDTSSHQTADSRPNTAPARTRTTGTTATSTSRSSGSSSRPRNGGTSSSSTATVPSTTSTEPKAGSIQMSALTSVLANLGNNTTEETEAAASSSKPTIDLYDIITSENLIPLLSNKDVQEKLRVHLPEGNTILNTEDELRESIRSPEFRQAVNAFGIALQSGELGPVLAQFNFPDEVINAANQGDIQAFAKALEKHYKISNEEVNEKESSDSTMDTN